MQKALHGISTHYCNVLTDARIARDTGYDCLELLSSKLIRYLDNGGTTAQLRQVVEGNGIKHFRLAPFFLRAVAFRPATRPALPLLSPVCEKTVGANRVQQGRDLKQSSEPAHAFGASFTE